MNGFGRWGYRMYLDWDLFLKIKSFFIVIVYCFLDFLKYFCVDFNCKFELMLLIVLLVDKECIFVGDINCNYLVLLDYKEIKLILVFFGLK